VGRDATAGAPIGLSQCRSAARAPAGRSPYAALFSDFDASSTSTRTRFPRLPAICGHRAQLVASAIRADCRSRSFLPLGYLQLTDKQQNGKPPTPRALQAWPDHLPNRLALAPLTRNHRGNGPGARPLAPSFTPARNSACLLISEATRFRNIGPWLSGQHPTSIESAGRRWRKVPIASTRCWRGASSSISSCSARSRNIAAAECGAALGAIGNPANARPLSAAPSHTFEPRALELEGSPASINRKFSGAARGRAEAVRRRRDPWRQRLLLRQFAKACSKQAHDAYGGSIENRAR